MPIYEYRCEKGHVFDVLHGVDDAPPTACPTCAKPVQRVFNPVAIHFKGSGFHNTDYGKRKTGVSTNGSESGGEGSKSDSAGEKKESKSKKAESPSAGSDSS